MLSCMFCLTKRGGVSSISKRYKGNNKYLKSYDPKQESNYT